MTHLSLLWLTLRQLILNSISFSQARLKSPPIMIRIKAAIVATTAKAIKNLIIRISFGILNIESLKEIQLLSKYRHVIISKASFVPAFDIITKKIHICGSCTTPKQAFDGIELTKYTTWNRKMSKSRKIIWVKFSIPKVKLKIPGKAFLKKLKKVFFTIFS